MSADDATQQHEAPDVLAAVGGVRGVIEGALPTAAFIVCHSVAGMESKPAAFIALGIGLLLTLARLARGETLQFAVSGLFGVGLAAFIVSRTGNGKDFYLPGLLANAGYATLCLITNALRRPAAGLFFGALHGDPVQPPLGANASEYRRITWMWMGIFLARLAVQLPLYAADADGALGVARVAMGVPLYAAGLWLTYLLARPKAPAPV